MSTDWGIGCRTCRDAGLPREGHFTGEWNNCRDTDALAVICSAAPVLARLPLDLDAHLTFESFSCSSDPFTGLMRFIRNHVGHVLAPMSEYGEFFDQCRQSIRCGTCHGPGCCALTLRHEGPCSLTVKP